MHGRAGEPPPPPADTRATLGEEQRVARAGEVVVAPAGVPHAFTNTGSMPLRQVDVHVSPRFETEWLE